MSTSTSRPVQVFFEPGAPPPVLPLPTCQTNLCYVDIPQAKSTNIWCEELRPPSLLSGKRRPVSDTRANRSRSSSPYSRRRFSSIVKRLPTPRIDPDDRARSKSPLSDISESSEASSSNDASSEAHELIPKPPGEVGRPKRGGYNMRKALGWSETRFNQLRNCVNELVDTYLDTTKSYQPQDERLRQLVRDKATQAIPDLAEFSGCWPVNDIMLMRLKQTSRRERLRSGKAERNTIAGGRTGRQSAD